MWCFWGGEVFTSVKHHVHNGFFRQLMVKAQELEKTHLIHGFINIYGFFNFRGFFYIFIVCKREIIWCLVRFFKHSWASIKMTRWFQSVCYLVLYKYHWHVWLEYFFDEHRYFYSISFWNNCWWNHSTKQIRKWKNLINYIVGTYITSDQMTCNSGNERCF